MNLLFDFTVDKATSTIYVTREFAADLDLVWDAFTKAEILDQWMGPKPYKVQTKEMDFREGGRWLYAMVSPENEVPSRFSLAVMSKCSAMALGVIACTATSTRIARLVGSAIAWKMSRLININ